MRYGCRQEISPGIGCFYRGMSSGRNMSLGELPFIVAPSKGCAIGGRDCIGECNMPRINLFIFTLWCLSCADNPASEPHGTDSAREDDSDGVTDSDTTGDETTGEQGSETDPSTGVKDSGSGLDTGGEGQTETGDAAESDSSASTGPQTDEDSDSGDEIDTEPHEGTSSESDTQGSGGSEGEVPSDSDTGSVSDSEAPTSDEKVYVGGCPDEAPTRGSVCSVPDLTCVYGDSPVVSCRHEALCFEGKWYISYGSCASAVCPEGISAGDDCATSGSHCLEETGTECVCLAELGNRWGCEPAPTPAAGCPSFPPYQGTACLEDSPTECTYERCLLADEIAAFQCAGGMWTGTLESCGEGHNR